MTTFMAREIAECGAVVARCLSENEAAFAAAADDLRALDPPVVATIARGSSDHCALYLKYLIEIALGVPCASIGPSIASLYRAPLKLEGALAVLDLAIRPQPRHRGDAARGAAAAAR